MILPGVKNGTVQAKKLGGQSKNQIQGFPKLMLPDSNSLYLVLQYSNLLDTIMYICKHNARTF